MITLDSIINDPFYVNHKDFQGKDAEPKRLLDYLSGEMLKYINHRDKEKVMEVYNLIKNSSVNWHTLSTPRQQSKRLMFEAIESGKFFIIDEKTI